MSISTKPPSGFRDFLPADVRRRNHVFRVIEEVYRSYGFEQLDTPALENLTTLLGKYGEEGDQLLFKVLLRGDKLARALEAAEPADTDLADLGLRYDLTVPLARVYAQYRNEFPRIFKRFQIAPVWRADRPQKGRYREFYQCDVDVVGSSSMTVEVEVTSALSEILEQLRFVGFRIHVNHRRLLTAILRVSGVPEDLHGAALVAIDKLDKIGEDGVRAELDRRQIPESAIGALADLTSTLDGKDDRQILALLAEQVGADDDGRAALEDLRQVLAFAKPAPSGKYLRLDPFLARGLSYYTGPIFEIRSDDFAGSLGGGGRYDELIGMFMKEPVPACGFSLGVERILLLMEERGLFDDLGSEVDVLVTMWNAEFAPNTLRLARELRDAGLRVDVYTDEDKYKKQFAYADQRGIGFVAILAPRELEEGVVAVKDMKSGEQVVVPRSKVAAFFAQRNERPV